MLPMAPKPWKSAYVPKKKWETQKFNKRSKNSKIDILYSFDTEIGSQSVSEGSLGHQMRLRGAAGTSYVVFDGFRTILCT